MLKTRSTEPAAQSADPRRFYFGAVTPAMADHLRRRSSANAERHALHAERTRSLHEERVREAADWLPTKDWQD